MYYNKKAKSKPQTTAAGSRWTKEEEERLMCAIREGKDVEEIAKDHKRMVGGIMYRKKDIAIRMMEEDGKSIEEVCDIMHVSRDDIISHQIERNKRKKVVPQKEDVNTEREIDILKDMLVDIRNILVRIEAKMFSDDESKKETPRPFSLGTDSASSEEECES